MYLERTLAPPLRRFVRALWYAQVPGGGHQRERILPSGRVQMILNLARDYILDCPEGQPDQIMAPSLIVGARSTYEIVDSSDMADLIGIVFEPGGFGPFVSDAADLFSNRSVALEDVWGSAATGLRDQLREQATPEARLDRLEEFLIERFAGLVQRDPMIEFALKQFEQAQGIAIIGEVAKCTGWSERRFSQVFREQVGLSPKVWCRLQRFQRALRQLHAGADLPWAELALDCGYYDQAHFANEFRAFSGIDATTYTARRTVWTNHVSAD